MGRPGIWILAVAISALASLGVGSCDPPTPCTGDFQCGAGQQCASLCPSFCPPGETCCAPGECVVAQCREDADCTPGSTCNRVGDRRPGRCDVTSCGSDAACADGSYCAGEYYPCGIPGCEFTGGVCLPRECGFDSDCPAGHRCEGSSICPPDVVCVWEGAPGICVGTQCSAHADCPYGCVDGFCAPPPVP